MTDNSPLHFGNSDWKPEEVASVATEPAEVVVQPRFLLVTGAHLKLRKYAKRIGKRVPYPLAIFASGRLYSRTN